MFYADGGCYCLRFRARGASVLPVLEWESRRIFYIAGHTAACCVINGGSYGFTPAGHASLLEWKSRRIYRIGGNIAACFM